MKENACVVFTRFFGWNVMKIEEIKFRLKNVQNVMVVDESKIDSKAISTHETEKSNAGTRTFWKKSIKGSG